MNNKKRLAVIIFFLGLVFLFTGVSYSLYNNSSLGNDNKMVLGDIYMHYNGSQSLNLTNVLPSDTYNKDDYFSFTIDGKNTSNKDIYYEILINHGEELAGKTRILDKFLKFTLVQVNGNNEIVLINNRSCNELNNAAIYIDTINKDSEVSNTYKLYMWISDSLLISNESGDYTMEEWKNIYASIKVDVVGDFTEKSLETAESCFKTITISNEAIITDYDSTCGSKVVIPSKINGVVVSTIGTRAFQDKNLTSVKIPDTITIIDPGAFQNNKIENVILNNNTYIGYNAFDSTVSSNKDLVKEETKESCFEASLLKDGTVAITGYDETCGLDVVIPSTIGGYPVSTIKGSEDLEIVRELNTKENSTFNDLNFYDDKEVKVRKVIPEPSNVEGSFVNSNVKRIVLPDTLKIVKSNAFWNSYITSIDLGNSLETIESNAFYGVKITNLVISNSVSVIGDYAFSQGSLKNIKVGNGLITLTNLTFATGLSTNPETLSISFEDIKYINKLAFTKERYVNLKSITINKKCSDIKNIEASSIDTTKYYPWFETDSSNILLYGMNSEVCDF